MRDKNTALRRGRITEVEPLGPGLAKIGIEGAGIAAGVVPGRFAMVGAPQRPDCILLRPYSYFTAYGDDRATFLLKVVGKGTRALVESEPGQEVDVLGPLGASFPQSAGSWWAVAGGVGAAPFGAMDHGAGNRVLFGARTAKEAGFRRALEAAGATVSLATDDGSDGFHGSVVDHLRALLETGERPDRILSCGPTGMMKAVSAVAREHEIPCWVSLEERMGCGIGVCRGCAHADASGGWRVICVDGPVYDAQEIFWASA